MPIPKKASLRYYTTPKQPLNILVCLTFHAHLLTFQVGRESLMWMGQESRTKLSHMAGNIKVCFFKHVQPSMCVLNDPLPPAIGVSCKPVHISLCPTCEYACLFLDCSNFMLAGVSIVGPYFHICDRSDRISGSGQYASFKTTSTVVHNSLFVYF